MLTFLLVLSRFDVLQHAPSATQWWLVTLMAMELAVEIGTAAMFDRRNLQ